jgi:electron transfer flavoprotein alpha/beta subunit
MNAIRMAHDIETHQVTRQLAERLEELQAKNVEDIDTQDVVA